MKQLEYKCEDILRPDDFHLVPLLEAQIVRLAWDILVECSE